MDKPALLPYGKVKEAIATGRTHLLLGNGFSISCDSIFNYKKLYDVAVSEGLSRRAQAVFARIGTNNFEAVLRLLGDGYWLAKTYKLKGPLSELLKDLKIIKHALVKAVAKSHLEHAGSIDSERKDLAVSFLKSYHNVFCTNYDLLVYWVNMHSGNPPPYEDGFRADSDDSTNKTLVFSERLGDTQGLFFLHGALHLFQGTGGIRKHCWERSGIRLTKLIREGLDEEKYPIFVAEGESDQKLKQIMHSGYLSYCLGKLGRVKGRLVTFGFAFGESDKHIENTIADNIFFTDLFIGMLPSGNNQSTFLSSKRMIARRDIIVKKSKGKVVPLNVFFYDALSANVWNIQK